jgi:hypothetical protein
MRLVVERGAPPGSEVRAGDVRRRGGRVIFRGDEVRALEYPAGAIFR